MQINLNVTANDVGELHAELRRLLSGYAAPSIDAPTASPSPVPPPSTRSEVIEPTDISVPAARKPRARKTADVTDINTNGDLVAPPAATPAPAPAPAEATPPTVEQVRDAIRDLMKATDENTVWATLQACGPTVKSASTAIEAGKGRELIDAAAKIIAAKTLAKAA